MKEDGTPEHVPDIIYFDEFDDLIDCTVSIPAVMKARYH